MLSGVGAQPANEIERTRCILVVGKSPSRWLKNYVEPAIPYELMWETHPLPVLPTGN